MLWNSNVTKLLACSGTLETHLNYNNLESNTHNLSLGVTSTLRGPAFNNMEEFENKRADFDFFTNLHERHAKLKPKQNLDEVDCFPKKKERRRTETMNLAFAHLREHIPNVPNDTKLSKIKTLRLAISYIRYLREVLDGEDPGEYVVDLKRDRTIAMDIANHYDHAEKRKKEVVSLRCE
jgi:hypothetical protein